MHPTLVGDSEGTAGATLNSLWQAAANTGKNTLSHPWMERVVVKVFLATFEHPGVRSWVSH